MDIVELSRSAWNALRSDHQPAFDDLEESYRQRLLDRAQNVSTLGYPTSEGGIFQTFEQNVVEALQPERFHPLSKAVRPDLFPEPEVAYNHDAITEAVVEAQKPKKAASKAKVVKIIKAAVKTVKAAAKKK